MRALQAGEASRGSGASGGSVRAPAATFALPTLLLAGLLLRLVVAYVLFPRAGFKVDIGSFTAWALTLADHGPGGFYQNAGFADYTPAYLYVLWLVGLAAKLIGGVTGAGAVAVAGELIKLPAIVADLALAYVLYRTMRGWVGERAGLIAAGLYLFNPVTWYESALWGQVDAVGVLVLLGAVLLLMRGWSEGAAGAAMLAAVVKPQYGIALLVVGAVLLRRHLIQPGSGPRPEVLEGPGAWLDRHLGGWFSREQGPWRLVSSAAAALVVLFVVITPFDLAELAQQVKATRAPWLPLGGDLGGLLVIIGSAAGEYHYLTVNAYNLWALVGPTSLAHAGVWTSDLLPAFAGISYVVFGTVLLLLTLALLGYQLLRRDDRASIVITATVLAVAFFVVPTRVHERYLFPAFALGALLAAASPGWRWWYVLLALVNVANLHGNLTNPLYGTPNVAALPLGDLIRSEPAVTLIAVGHTALFGWALWRVRPALDDVRRLLRPGHDAVGTAAAVEMEQAARPRMAWRTPWSRPPEGLAANGGPAAPPGGTAASRVGAATVSPSADEPGAAQTGGGLEAPFGEEQAPAPVPLGALRRRLALRSDRPDRSVALHGEGGGRFDRLDLLILVLLVATTFATRTFRLGQPYGMHFDEVYHARTATEFLQDWRYGIPHSIYEYTHPHLAKYLIAAGIVAFGDNAATARGDLGTPVRSVLIEPRYVDPADPGRRAGDRLFVASGSVVRVIDLQTRADESRLSVGRAVALALDPDGHSVYVGAETGVIWKQETSRLDLLRAIGGEPQAVQPLEIARVPAPVRQLWLVDRGHLVVQSGDDTLSSIDLEGGTTAATVTVPGIASALPLQGVPTVVAHPAEVSDPEGVDRRLAGLLDQPPGTFLGDLRKPLPEVALAWYLKPTVRSQVQASIDAGELPGIAVTERGVLAIAVSDGLALLDGASLATAARVALPAAATGLDRVAGLDQPYLYVATAAWRVETVRLGSEGPPSRGAGFAMPGPVSDVRWNAATNLVHVLGMTRDGRPTVYVVEPHANAVFADAALPFQPVAWTLDVLPGYPALDRQEALAFGAQGQVASIDTGSNAFAWRFPGVIAGVLMAAAIYLLARLLFRRRSVGLLVAALVTLDSVFFAQSRIAMNDSYVGLFIVAAYLLAAYLLGRPWRGRAAWLALGLGLPTVGVLLGLAIAAKWVGLYALGGVLLLVLLRSALGRLLALAGMVGLTGTLGYLAVAEAPANYTFLLLMLGLTALLAAGMALRPVAFSREEVRFAAVAPVVAGALVLLGVAAGSLVGLLPAGSSTATAGLVGAAALVALGPLAYGGFVALARYGMGPLAVARRGAAGERALQPASPPEGWLRPGWRFGLPFTWALGTLVVVPLAVYVLSYVPWARPWDTTCVQRDDCPQLFPGWPPGHHGQTFLELQGAMYSYHDTLRATHPASSPWWAWPLDLKPVWFYSQSFAAGTQGLIFDVGNLVIFWLAIPAVAFGAWQAWRRRSPALAFLVIAIAAQWLPWARIDRATFQYHFYTALPFALLLLAYFLAELWHGPSRRTWVLARVAAALALLGPGLLWLFKDPFCALAGVRAVNPSSYLCGGASAPVAISERTVVTVLVLAIGVVAIVWQIGRLAPARTAGARALLASWARPDARALAGLAGTTAATLLVLAAIQRVVGDRVLISFQGRTTDTWILAVVAIAAMAIPAWLVLGARDPRRYVVVAMGTAACFFVVFYPYFSGLPVPLWGAFTFQRLLPTWDYSFQFAVNTAPARSASLLGPVPLAFVAAAGIAAVAVLYAVGAWRAELEERGRASDDASKGRARAAP